jgi:hypothetical protein
MPEDPVGAEQASAQWRAHLAAEERERELAYDRRKLDENRAVLAMMRRARERYDHASTRQSIDKVRIAMPTSITKIRRQIELVDPWGVNSHLLADYAAMLAALTDAYPAARGAAVEGHREALDELRASWDQREASICEWLREAASSGND